MLKSLCKKVADIQDSNFIRIRPQGGVSPVAFTKFLRRPVLHTQHIWTTASNKNYLI